jgi:hypothetical protein
MHEKQLLLSFSKLSLPGNDIGYQTIQGWLLTSGTGSLASLLKLRIPVGSTNHLGPWTALLTLSQRFILACVDSRQHLLHAMFVGVMFDDAGSRSFTHRGSFLRMRSVIFYLLTKLRHVRERDDLLSNLKELR